MSSEHSHIDMKTRLTPVMAGLLLAALIGLLGLFLVTRTQIGSYLGKWPLFTGLLSPIALSVMTAYLSSKRSVRFSSFLRLFTAGLAYFTHFGLLNIIHMSYTGVPSDLIITGLAAVALSAVPYIAWRNHRPLAAHQLELPVITPQGEDTHA